MPCTPLLTQFNIRPVDSLTGNDEIFKVILRYKPSNDYQNNYLLL